MKLVTLIISIGIFLWPSLLLLYKLYGLFYIRVYLPCGSFKVRAMYRYDMNVMTRIVSKEFFGGGVVDATIMATLYKRYGPLSWEASDKRWQNLWRGFCTWLDRVFFYGLRHRKRWLHEDMRIV